MEPSCPSRSYLGGIPPGHLPCERRPAQTGHSVDPVTKICKTCSDETKQESAQRRTRGKCIQRGCTNDVAEVDRQKRFTRCGGCRLRRAHFDRDRRAKRRTLLTELSTIQSHSEIQISDTVVDLSSMVNKSEVPTVKTEDTNAPIRDEKCTEQVERLGRLIKEMDDALSRNHDENETLREHWLLFKDIMPEEPEDWFADLETLSSMGQKHAELGNKDSIGVANVLETTEEELDVTWNPTDPALDHLGVIVIRKSLHNPHKSARSIRQTLEVCYHDAQAELQNYGIGGGVVYEEMHRVMKRFCEGQESIEHGQRRKETPHNILSLRSEIVADVQVPEALKTMDCSLLSILCQRVRAAALVTQTLTSASKKKTEPDWLMDLESCLRFGLLAERGALTMAHLDVLNGTWVTCLSGVKLWCIYQGHWDEHTKQEFVHNGQHWRPQKGTVKMIFLEPGDTLIMRPGFAIPHWVLTLANCIMAGGMIWSAKDIGKIMSNLEYTMGNSRVTNEHIPRQFTAILDTLLNLANGPRLPSLEFSSEDVESMRRLKEKLIPILSCQCGEGCREKNCACLTLEGEDRDRRESGCTTWCHPNIDDFRDPQRACARLPHAKTRTCQCKNKKCEKNCACRRQPREYCSPYCHPGTQCENCEEKDLREKIAELERQLSKANRHWC